MKNELQLYNSLSRKKEVFQPIEEGYVGMYVCGPTVYSDVHLGNCRTFVSFDIIFRYLKYLGYRVRYVRNITDVGHLLDDGEDRISKGARSEKLEPMEVVQKYTLGFHDMMRIFNTESPSIEPRASGHIQEQIEMVQAILDNGLAYEKNGSVYFDVEKFAKDEDVYGKLSGRVLEDLLVETRDLKNQSEKKHPSDFAIWMKAAPDHLMHWNSPWSVGFPGWHLECSVMSTKYLGKTFDIHGGGNDLKFPHHENEVAQNFGACKCQPSNYWLHTNMLLMNGRKMSKSDGNTISPEELFTGESPHVTQGYSPMTLRFFMLQAHYRSTMDISDDALKAAEKGYRKLMEANKTLTNLSTTASGTESDLDKEINDLVDQALAHMLDDFNTPQALARLFELVNKINGLKDGHLAIADVNLATLDKLKQKFHDFIFVIFGLQDEVANDGGSTTEGLMQLIIELRNQARTQKDWPTADKIRDTLKELEIQLKDAKGETSWIKG